MTADELNEWGIPFIEEIDRRIMLPGNENIKAMWMEGEGHSCIPWIREQFPEVTEQQADWIEDFLSEV